MVKMILTTEFHLYQRVENLKKALLSNFRNRVELYNFLKILYEDISNWNHLNKKTINFLLINEKIRI